MRIFWWVNVYDMDRCFGGPEEGGWWYDVGTNLASFARLTRKGAEELRERLRNAWPTGEGMGSRYSMAYTGEGDYNICIEKTKGKDFNDYRPYE